MKLPAFVLALSCLSITASALQAQQWTYPNTGVAAFDGNVGVGTSAPADKLEVSTGSGNLGIRITTSGNTATDYSALRLFQGGTEKGVIYTNQENMFINRSGTGNLLLANSGGNVAIGTTNAMTRLTVMGKGSGDGIWLAGTGATNVALLNNMGQGGWNRLTQPGDNMLLWKGSAVESADAGGLVIGTWSNDYKGIRITAAGNVGIGTPTPQSKLAVQGDITCQKVKVTLNGWADYVFNKSYRLRPLIEVEQYIQQHNHLPEVPSAAEVEKNGLDLAGNQATLLKKIEELTLYIIEQQKEIKELKKEMKDLKEAGRPKK